MNTNIDAILSQFQELLAIDSPTGLYEEIEAYLVKKAEEYGYKTTTMRKGGVIVDLGGEGEDLYLTSHVDTLGLMVRSIYPDGTLKVVPIGGLLPINAARENVKVHTRKGQIYSGTVQRIHSCAHIAPPGANTECEDYEKNLCIVLDEDVTSKDDAAKLGIRVGDFISLEPRYQYVNGYIKSQFIDDKICSAMLLVLMKELKEYGWKLKRHVTLGFSCYEEVGHGGSWIPEGTQDMIAFDTNCVGPTNVANEKKVTIVAKDSRFPYHNGLVNELIDLAESHDINYEIDVFTPSFGTDSDGALNAGYDIRGGGFGPARSGSHGYERTHINSLDNCYKLVKAMILEEE